MCDQQKLKRRLHRFVRVYTYQNATLLEITCRGSLMIALVQDSFSMVAINPVTLKKNCVKMRFIDDGTVIFYLLVG